MTAVVCDRIRDVRFPAVSAIAESCSACASSVWLALGELRLVGSDPRIVCRGCAACETCADPSCRVAELSAADDVAFAAWRAAGSHHGDELERARFAVLHDWCDANTACLRRAAARDAEREPGTTTARWARRWLSALDDLKDLRAERDELRAHLRQAWSS